MVDGGRLLLGKTDGNEKNSGSNYASSVNIYFRDINRIERFSAEEQEELSSCIDAAYDSLREKLRHFVFVQRDYLRRFNSCLENNCADELEKYFTYSSLQKHFSPDFVPQSDLLSRTLKLKEYLSLSEAAYSAGKSVPIEVQEKLFECCSDYELHGHIVNELINYAVDYLKLLTDSPASDAAGFAGSKFHLPKTEIIEKVNEILREQDSLRLLENRLAEANLRLVVNVAKFYRNRGLAFDDLIQEGNLGLLHAISRYDFKSGHKFSTYATYWIRNMVLKAVAEQTRIIRLPAHMIRQIAMINYEEQRLIQHTGEFPDDAQIAEVMGLSTSRVKSIRLMASQAISLQESLGQDDESGTLEDMLPDLQGDSPEQRLAQKNTLDKLYKLIDALPDREQQILIMHYGLFGGKKYSLEEIGLKFNLTRERIRQLEIKVLKTLRSPENRRCLDDFIAGR